MLFIAISLLVWLEKKKKKKKKIYIYMSEIATMSKIFQYQDKCCTTR